MAGGPGFTIYDSGRIKRCPLSVARVCPVRPKLLLHDRKGLAYAFSLDTFSSPASCLWRISASMLFKWNLADISMLGYIMNSNFRSGRCLLWTGAALLFSITLVMSVGVVPIVRTNTSSQAISEWMVMLFRACVGFNCVGATTLAFIAVRVTNLGWICGIFLGTVMLLALLFSFVLTDAAFDFHTGGPALQIVAILLHLCAAADFIVALLVVIAVGLLPKRTIATA